MRSLTHLFDVLAQFSHHLRKRIIVVAMAAMRLLAAAISTMALLLPLPLGGAVGIPMLARVSIA